MTAKRRGRSTGSYWGNCWQLSHTKSLDVDNRTWTNHTQFYFWTKLLRMLWQVRFKHLKRVALLVQEITVLCNTITIIRIEHSSRSYGEEVKYYGQHYRQKQPKQRPPVPSISGRNQQFSLFPWKQDFNSWIKITQGPKNARFQKHSSTLRFSK